MVAVAREHERACNDVMDKHLPMIFPPLLNVHHNHLLYVKGELDEIVPLEKTAHLPIRPAGP